MTVLLNRLGQGEPEVESELWPLVYGELVKLARAHASAPARAGELQPTALVHEAWLKLAEGTSSFECRAQFFALASRVMRSVLVDAARARAAEKRGGRLERITLDEGLIGDAPRAVDAVALDEVLVRLEQLDPDLARLVEMRFFGGLKHPAIAELLGRSLRRVERDWRLARSWLRIELER